MSIILKTILSTEHVLTTLRIIITGKRDSQLILMQFLSRVHFDSDMCPLDLELAIHIHTVLDLDPGAFEYALFVDADTDIAPDSLNRLVACMINDASIMGLCGETSIKNEMASWVTAIQVYEYFISHAMAKAFGRSKSWDLIYGPIAFNQHCLNPLKS